MSDPVPYFDLKAQYQELKDEILPALERVCENTAFANGPEVAAFEQAFADYCEVEHCIGVSSGTSALHVMLTCLGVGPGDEVITTPFTFIATAWAITYCGATPVFVDIEETTRNIDPAKIEAAITDKTKLILPVHIYGLPADMDAIQAIGDKHGVAVAEDAAQAHGARYRGVRAGGIASMGSFSFYPGKNLGAYGEGGAITTNDSDLAKRARQLRDHAQSKRYYHDEVGFNYRMDGFQGAVLGVKLKHLDRWNDRRHEIARVYSEAFRDLPIDLPHVPEDVDSAWHLYVIRTDDRDRFREALEADGVPTALHYPVCVHQQAPYAPLGYGSGSLPVAEHMSQGCVSMPFFPEMTDEHVARVVDRVRAFFG